MPDEPVKAQIPPSPEVFWRSPEEHRWFRPSHLEPDALRRVRGQRLPRQVGGQPMHQTRLGRGVVRAPGRLWDPLQGWVDAPPEGGRQVWVKKQPLPVKKREDSDEEKWPVGKVAKEFCEDTSLHGVQYLGEGHWVER